MRHTNRTLLTRDRAAQIVEEFLTSIPDISPTVLRAWRMVKDQPWLLETPATDPQRSDPGWRALNTEMVTLGYEDE